MTFVLLYLLIFNHYFYASTMLRGMKKVHREELPINVQKCYKLSRGPVTKDQGVNNGRKGNLDSSLSLSAMYSELDKLLRDRSSPFDM